MHVFHIMMQDETSRITLQKSVVHAPFRKYEDFKEKLGRKKLAETEHTGALQ